MITGLNDTPETGEMPEPQDGRDAATNLPMIDILRSVHPVLMVSSDDSTALSSYQFWGTAFAVAPGVFLTANHVVTHESQRDDIFSVGAFGGSGADEAMRGAKVEDIERFPDIDLAILHCAVARGVPIFASWLKTRLQVLSDVAAFGFPHATEMNAGESKITAVFRAFKGHVITIRGFERLPRRPAVYELATHLPIGMSGAPALWHFNGGLHLVGIVLGEDVIHYRGLENRAGIVLPTDTFVGIYSQRLGKHLGELVKVAVLGVRLPPAKQAET